MTHQNEHAETSLLFIGHTAPLDAVDTVALRFVIEGMGVSVRQVRAQEGEYVHLICDSVQILVAGFDRPFPMAHFRGVSRRLEDDGQQREVLSLLAGHGSSLTILVMDHADRPGEADLALKTKICNETVDLLLATTSPDLVFWSNDDHLVTAAEAEATIEGSDLAATEKSVCRTSTDINSAKVPTTIAPLTMRPAGSSAPQQCGGVDLGGTDLVTGPLKVHPKSPRPAESQADCGGARPTHVWDDPQLSPDVIKWFEGETENDGYATVSDELSGLRSFFALDKSPEPRRIAETASGRASLYLMSATIAVFALPMGALMLAYNALSGGSFRYTSYVMALTGIGMALGGLGVFASAAALTGGFK